MRQRRGRLGRDDAGDRRQLHRHFVKHQDFVEADLDVFVEFRNDVNAAQTFGDVERLVFLIARNLGLQDALQTLDVGGGFVLAV